MKIKNVCHLPFFAQEPSRSRGLDSVLSTSRADLGQRTRQRPTLRVSLRVRRALAAGQGHGLLIITIAICIWVGFLSDVYPVVSCVYILKAHSYTYNCMFRYVSCCILMYLKCILKALFFFGKEILNGNRRRNMTAVLQLYSVIACLASDRRRLAIQFATALFRGPW